MRVGRHIRFLCASSLTLSVAWLACSPVDDPDTDGDTAPKSSEGIPPTVVGTDGANVFGKSVNLHIPAGALTEEVTLSAQPLEEATLAALPEATAPGLEGTATLTDAVFVFTPHGTRFAVPVTIELVHEGNGDVVLRLDDEQDTSWELVEGAVFSEGVARFEVQGFSIYAVAASLRACKRAFCLSVPESLQCGLIDDTCGGQVDLNADCGRPACASCGADNTCTGGGCTSTFSCATTTAQCGTEVDNCGTAHDVVAECPNIQGCGAKGTCTNLNLCGACTPYANCSEALAAAGDVCNPSVPDGCGGVMDCGGTCTGGNTCLYVKDAYASGGGDWACKIPCTSNSQCPASEAECIDSNTLVVRNWVCQDNTYCLGNQSATQCMDLAGNPTQCVNNRCEE